MTKTGLAVYEKYFNAHGGIHPDTGNPLPEWSQLTESEQRQWNALAADEGDDGGENVAPPPTGPGQGPGGN